MLVFKNPDPQKNLNPVAFVEMTQNQAFQSKIE